MGGQCRRFERQPRARDRMWSAMRILRRFTMPDIVAAAETQYKGAQAYFKGLENAGYLRLVAKKGNQKGQFAVWMLVRDSGPKAPRLQSDGRTYDPNTHDVHEGGRKQ